MPWVTWIETEPDATTDPGCRAVYDRTRDAATRKVPDTVRLLSRTPEVAGLVFDLYQAVYRNARGLSLREREIVSVIVASLNGCVH